MPKRKQIMGYIIFSFSELMTVCIYIHVIMKYERILQEKKILTCVSQTKKTMLLRGHSNGRRSHGVFKIFPEVKKSIEAK